MSPEAPASNPAVRPARRRCLCLCLPALLIYAALRISVMQVLPEADYGSDSHSYFEAASEQWNEGVFEVKAKRRRSYPVLLMVAPALPGRTVTVIPTSTRLLQKPCSGAEAHP